MTSSAVQAVIGDSQSAELVKSDQFLGWVGQRSNSEECLNPSKAVVCPFVTFRDY